MWYVIDNYRPVSYLEIKIMIKTTPFISFTFYNALLIGHFYLPIFRVETEKSLKLLIFE